ncbi:hypothetical protein PINS_up018781 [Pythium insidiosum]|nr:hypothetical protein PINS_up008562 [Pythium insidiosum]GLD99835.1 hypothetical protein PINS_up008563 [Pythium insidiosum]GLD99836.1 hypothetical protein PINS_up008564 [Pythium insidiosum]GLD99837.1 hypothetical protein PINS_up008565 [Pythium insidiosum]GLD99838.1 hypothetical protein PINS_up008566 [Pythium insidiosum]
MQTSTLSGKYFVTFIDDKSRFVVIYVMEQKSEVADKFVRATSRRSTSGVARSTSLT